MQVMWLNTIMHLLFYLTLIEKMFANVLTLTIGGYIIRIISKKYKIAPSFIVGRMAKMNMINYNSKIYNELKDA